MQLRTSSLSPVLNQQVTGCWFAPKYSKLWPPYQPFPRPFKGVIMLLLITPSFDRPMLTWPPIVHHFKRDDIHKASTTFYNVLNRCWICIILCLEVTWWTSFPRATTTVGIAKSRIPYDTIWYHESEWFLYTTENHVEPLPTISGKTFTEASHVAWVLLGPGGLGWSVASGHQGQSPWRQPYDANFIGSLHVPILSPQPQKWSLDECGRV
jgi:hypothetical protein